MCKKQEEKQGNTKMNNELPAARPAPGSGGAFARACGASAGGAAADGNGAGADSYAAALSCAMEAGELLLMYGAEAGRVEDTVQRMCRAYGFAHTDVFTITSGIVTTAWTADGQSYTESRRIRERMTNLGRIDRVNTLSRRFCAGSMALPALREELRRVRCAPPGPAWLEPLLYMGISCALSVFFGGTAADGAASALSGLVLYAMIRMGTGLQMNNLLQTVLSSAVTAAAVLVLVRAGLGTHADKIMIGNIMLVIPGIQLTSSLRDMINGDTISGLLNLSEAVLKAISVALGFSLVLLAGGAL